MKKPKYITKSGQPWTKKEVEGLKSMGGKVPTRVIGLKLQRPEAGVRAKAQEIGLSLKPVNKSPRSKLKQINPYKLLRREDLCHA